MSDEESLRDYLFKLTMKQQWEKVAKKYEEDENAHTLMLTKLEDTAFHKAISSYNPDCCNAPHESFTRKMYSLMNDKKTLCKVLEMPNTRGDTPLHLAAAVGWEAICIRIASEDPKLIEIRNSNGETPLFISAHHGNLQTFISLHGIYNHGKDKGDESLCRRKDGNTVLHSAISGEYFSKNILRYTNFPYFLFPSEFLFEFKYEPSRFSDFSLN